MRGGASHLCSSRALHQRRAHHPLHMHLQCCRMHAHRCNIVHRWQATRRWTSRMKSTAVMVGKIAAPPLSATTRGVEILKVAASRKTSTHMHQCVGVQSHMRHTPNSPGVWGGGAWCLPHICVWWSGHTSFGPTYQRSTTGRSTQLNSCRSTPPPSSP
jgi:hypothetical protein